jgi:hypothetical protein
MKVGWTEMRLSLRKRFEDPTQLRASSWVALGFAGIFLAQVFAKSFLREPRPIEVCFWLLAVVLFASFGSWCRVQARTCERIIALEKGLEELKLAQAERR